METMGRFLAQQRNRIWMKALLSSATICLLLYIIIRSLTYDFPMSWREEILLFFKVILSGTCMMVVATTGSATIYKTFLRIKRNKKVE
jgi:hypothetical protein